MRNRFFVNTACVKRLDNLSIRGSFNGRVGENLHIDFFSLNHSSTFFAHMKLFFNNLRHFLYTARLPETTEGFFFLSTTSTGITITTACFIKNMFKQNKGITKCS